MIFKYCHIAKPYPLGVISKLSSYLAMQNSQNIKHLLGDRNIDIKMFSESQGENDWFDYVLGFRIDPQLQFPGWLQFQLPPDQVRGRLCKSLL
jgi:hypothetical protein